MRKEKFVLVVGIILFSILITARGWPETISWVNPTTDVTGAALTTTEQAALKNFLRYKIMTGGAWTYFGETTGGKTTWTGTLPVAVGVAADYTVSAALMGQDGIERDSVMSEATRYTIPFPPGKTPAAPGGPSISRP